MQKKNKIELQLCLGLGARSGACTFAFSIHSTHIFKLGQVPQAKIKAAEHTLLLGCKNHRIIH